MTNFKKKKIKIHTNKRLNKFLMKKRNDVLKENKEIKKYRFYSDESDPMLW
jgi:hypothetical protein